MQFHVILTKCKCESLRKGEKEEGKKAIYTRLKRLVPSSQEGIVFKYHFVLIYLHCPT